MNNLSRPAHQHLHTSQPNLDAPDVQHPWSASFLLITAIVGVGAGLTGGALMRLLAVPALLGSGVATAPCLRAGASGGLFTPSMTIGALLGSLFGHVWLHLFRAASMVSCPVIGACAFLAAANQGPISALVLVLELTRHVDATMVPMLLAVTGAMLAARHIEANSIYTIRSPA